MMRRLVSAPLVPCANISRLKVNISYTSGSHNAACFCDRRTRRSLEGGIPIAVGAEVIDMYKNINCVLHPSGDIRYPYRTFKVSGIVVTRNHEIASDKKC